MSRLIRPYEPRLNIIRNGLILWHDISLRTSYPASGVSITDLSGNGHTGTLTNGATYNSSNNGYIALDGSNDHIVVADTSALNFANNMTLSIWVKMNAFPNNFIGIIDKYVGTTSGYMIDIPSSTNKNPRFTIYNGANTSVTATTIMNNTSWYNITATFDSQYMSIYVNGNYEGQVGPTANIVTNTVNLAIGGDGASTNFANANIGMLLIYNRSLLANEVTHNFNITKARFGL